MRFREAIKMKKKKALIVTWFSDSNFGQVLQAYAMQTIFRKLGFDTTILLYQPDMQNSNWLSYYSRNHTHFANSNHQLRQTLFEVFVRANLKFTHPCANLAEVKQILNQNQYDVFVCGSDQIWNPDCYDPVHYLDFGAEYKQPRIAYAPSICDESLIPLYGRTIDMMARSMEKVDYLSAREKTGCSIIHNLTGRTAFNVLDPTLLLPARTWFQFAYPFPRKRTYILCFFLGNIKTFEKDIQTIQQKRKIDDVIVIQNKSMEKSETFKTITSLEPKGFITLMKHASFVCTDSFHGTAFSINLHKQFFVFQRKVTGLKGKDLTYHNVHRVTDLLEILELNDRIIRHGEDSSSILKQADLDYTCIETKLRKQRKKSWAFLRNAVKENEL